MLRAIAEIVNRDGLDGYVITWSVPLPLSTAAIERKAAPAA
jgi:hypothetical protein